KLQLPVGATPVATAGSGGDAVATGVAPTRAVDFLPHLDTSLKEPRATVLIPGARTRYLAEIAEQGRAINGSIERQAEAADRAQSYWQSLRDLGDTALPKALGLYDDSDLSPAWLGGHAAA